jgi:tetratricopeptide (TPR) repeat protein
MLMDFGLAKVSGATKLTRTGTTMGTVAYMSPEQVQGREADHRSDIWALGVVLYEMVSGHAPFGGDYEAALLYSILNEDQAPLAVEGSDIPAGLDGIIAKALAKDPARRYQKAEELVADLDALARDSKALPAGKAMPARGVRRLWRRWSPWQRATAVASLVALAALGSTLVIRFGIMAPKAAQYSLAVMDFHDATSGSDSTLSAQITELVNTGLIQSLIQTDVVRVKSLDLLHDLRRRLYGQRRGAIDRSQTFNLARQAEATLYLAGTIGQAGSNQFVDWELVDARNGDVVGGGRAEGAKQTVIVDQIIEKALPWIARAFGVKAAIASTPVEIITTPSLRAYGHYMAGLLAAEEDRGRDALVEFEKAIVEDSTFALAYLECARVAPQLGPGSWARNRKYAEKAWSLRSHLGKKDLMRLEARRQRLNGELAAAIAMLREIHERWPDDRQTLIELRDELDHWWNYHDLLAIDEEGQRLYPDDVVFGGPDYFGALVTLGRTEEAFAATRAFVKRHPKDPNAWDELGWRYLQKGLPDSAETAFRRAVELDPNWNPENFCYCAYYRGDLKGAIACFERLLERKDIAENRRWSLIVLPHVVLNLGALYSEAGRCEDLRKAIKGYTDPSVISNPELRLLVHAHRPQEVVDLYWQMHTYRLKVELPSLPPEASRNLSAQDSILGWEPRLLGQALAMLGDVKGAREVVAFYANKISQMGGYARYDALDIEARAALADNDPKTALKTLTEMKENGVAWGGFIYLDYCTMLANAYRMDGQLEKAAAVHKEVLRLFGGHALSHYELGKIFEQMKRPADAKKEYAKFLEMWSEADEDLPPLIDARKRLAAL